MKTTPVIRAIDVGYGTTSFILGEDGSGIPSCGIFPSRVFPATEREAAREILSKRDTVTVPVNNKLYEVGPDIALRNKVRGNVHVQHEKYIETDQYMALFRGALRYMDIPEIDMLVVCLPVRYQRTKYRQLEKRLEGEHPIGEGKTVRVRNVLSISQPLGGLVSHITRQGNYAAFQDKKNLIVDPGYFTLDWMMARGVKEVTEYSDSIPCGVSNFLKSIALQISEERSIDYDDLDEIDTGLRKGNFTLYGKPVDLTPYIPKAQDALSHAVEAFANGIGDGRSIHNVYLVGGGAPIFRDLIQQVLPDHQIHLVEDGVFANVRGFYYSGKGCVKRRAA